MFAVVARCFSQRGNAQTSVMLQLTHSFLEGLFVTEVLVQLFKVSGSLERCKVLDPCEQITLFFRTSPLRGGVPPVIDQIALK